MAAQSPAAAATVEEPAGVTTMAPVVRHSHRPANMRRRLWLLLLLAVWQLPLPSHSSSSGSVSDSGDIEEGQPLQFFNYTPSVRSSIVVT